MTDKEIKNCNCGANCADEHDNCECDSEECDCNTITLDMEDGTTKDFIVLEVLEHEGKQYIALAEPDTMEYDILSMTVSGDNVELGVIEDDDEFEKVAAKFDELFSQSDEEPED
ncbi:MAG TPA: DUF1292 domain-containing protein [Candidatus Syntrophosphaera sp.]|jgi:hypothetical protein|nr:DUF1292 domain-containing protein [Candidatus Syntrophosphaera sp.]